jgi:hypothetical protein
MTMRVLFIATTTSSYIKQEKNNKEENNELVVIICNKKQLAKNKMTLMMNKRLPSLFVLCWCKGDGGMVEGDR